MTLDEMIAFVSDEAAVALQEAKASIKVWGNNNANVSSYVRRRNERAAALINVENALRRMKAMADEASGELA